MRFNDLKPRRSRTKMSSKRRGARFMRGIFDRYHFYKATLKYGRRKPIRWWHK